MKKIFLATITLLMATSALAQSRPRPNFPGTPDAPNYRPLPPGGGFDGRNRPSYDRFHDVDGKKFIPIEPICGITDVKMRIMGDDITVRELTVLFDRGSESVATRTNYRDGEETEWVRLMNQGRCIRGLFVEAYTRPDFDSDSATLMVWGAMPDSRRRLQVVDLARVYLKDYNERRGYRRPPGGGDHGRPGRPGDDFGRPPRIVPTAQWLNLGSVRAEKVVSTTHTFAVNQPMATEVSVLASKSPINIMSAHVIDQFGQRHPISGLIGRASRDVLKTARLSDRGVMAVQSIELEIMTDGLIGSRGELNVQVGIADRRRF